MPSDDEWPSKPRKKVHRRETGYAPRFLTFSCYRQMPLLGRAEIRNVILDCLREALEGGRMDSGRLDTTLSAKEHARRLRHDDHPLIGGGRPFRLIAYVIMPEHVHLMVCPGHEAGGTGSNLPVPPALL